MKYIKRYNEDIDWDFDIQEENIYDEFIGHEKFYRFLVMYNILDKFVKNFYTSNAEKFRKAVGSNAESIKKYLDFLDKHEYIESSFDWSDDKQTNWLRVHNRWIKSI